jgi:hypothetical protein
MHVAHMGDGGRMVTAWTALPLAKRHLAGEGGGLKGALCLVPYHSLISGLPKYPLCPLSSSCCVLLVYTSAGLSKF